jgi:hypothetical protein
MNRAGNAAQDSDTLDKSDMVHCAVPQFHAHMAAAASVKAQLYQQNQMNNRIRKIDRGGANQESDQFEPMEECRMSQCRARDLWEPRLDPVASKQKETPASACQRLNEKMGEISGQTKKK